MGLKAQDSTEVKSGTIGVRKSTIALYAERAGIHNKSYRAVTSFNFTCWFATSNPIESSISNALTSKMQDQIKCIIDTVNLYGLDKGMQASFEKITAKDEDGKEITLPSFTVAIK